MGASADALGWLHASLRRRETPEAVAEVIAAALPAGLPPDVSASLDEVRAASLHRRFGWSSMPAVFRAPDAMERQVAKARELAELFLGRRLPGADDPDAVQALIGELGSLIGRTPGQGSFKADRLDHGQRAAAGLTLSRRRYGKLFRLAGRLEDRLARLRRQEAQYRLLLVGKAALAPDLALDDLGNDLATAAFVAYYAARLKLRSEFTVTGQQRPFDALASGLLRHCEGRPGTRWHAVAHVFPRADVLAHLGDEQKGHLLGRWFDVLGETAEHLEAVHARTDLDLATMVVRRGNDSSTWNLLATAWNRARDHWLALVAALGLDALLDTMMPGKVMRLVAADVAAWHRATGGGIHPDTLVWAGLPKPWAVLRGEAACSRATIEAACARHGVDPAAGGWSAPRPLTEVAAARPTPELVHGVTVSNPYVAALLRRTGVFSGKAPRPLPELFQD